MSELAARYSSPNNSTGPGAEKGAVLALGGSDEEACRAVARACGFGRVLTRSDLPSSQSKRGVDAIFVFGDSTNWAADAQAILETAQTTETQKRPRTRTETRLGTRSDTAPPLLLPIYFSHCDMVGPALSQQQDPGREGHGGNNTRGVSIGALRRIVETLLSDMSVPTPRNSNSTSTSTSTSRRKLRTYAFGRPQVATLEFASQLLGRWRAAQRGATTTTSTTTSTTTTTSSSSSSSSAAAAATAAAGSKEGSHEDPANPPATATGNEETLQEEIPAKPPATVYFVGDTPESDIRAANAMDARCSETEWYSILVRTGTAHQGEMQSHPQTQPPRYRARRTVDTVLDAVNHAIRREMARQKRLPLDEAAMKAIAQGRTPNFVTRAGPFSEP